MRKLDITALLLVFLLAIPSARAVFKYINIFEPAPIIIYTLATFFLVIVLKKLRSYPTFEKWLGSYWYIAFVLLSVSLLVVFMYPIADGLKTQMRGSDQDDCVIIGASQLLNFSHPYTQTSYFGNPCSPGLGMLLIYLPFVAFNLYPLAALSFALFAILTLQRHFSSTFKVAFFTTLLFSCFFVIEMLVVGSDLFIIGFGLVILGYQLIEKLKNKSIIGILWLAIFTGLIASARVNFLVLLPVISIFVFLHWRRGAFIFAAVSACVAILPSLYIYVLDPASFSPFHLVGKSDNLLKGGLKEIGLIASAAAFFVSVYIVRKSVECIPIALALSLAPSLLSVAIGDLLWSRSGNISLWEGANYLLPILPLSVALLTNRLFRSNPSELAP